MKLSSHIVAGSDAYQANRSAHLAALADVTAVAEAARLGGGEKARERHRSRGNHCISPTPDQRDAGAECTFGPDD